MNPIQTLAGVGLFGAIPTEALNDVARLMTSVSFAPGEVLWRKGDRGDRLIVVAGGELEVLLEVPGSDPLRVASMGPGQVVGELALLGDGKRTATVRAVTGTTGWQLERNAFEVLRHDVRSATSQIVEAIGRHASVRLDGLYRRCAEEIDGAPPDDRGAPMSIGEVAPEDGEIDYLAGILFFRDFTRGEIVEVLAETPRIAVPRGAVVTPVGERPSALWIVARGAVETSMRGAGATHSLRLAGPGRAIGHAGLLGEDAFVERIESRARERSILVEVPWTSVNRLLTDDAPAARRFAAALWTDVVRALQYGERPLARTRTPFGAGRLEPPGPVW